MTSADHVPAGARAHTRKAVPSRGVTPNLVDYEAACAAFSWHAARAELDGLPGGGLNIAHEAVDRNAAGPRADHVALRLLGPPGSRREVTYAELAVLSDRFAAGLAALGIGREERVFVLAHRTLELYVAALGTLKNGSVLCPLFSAFGSEPVRQRMARGDARALVTTASMYRRKVAPVRAELPDLEHVLLIDGGPVDQSAVPGGRDLQDLLSTPAPSGFTIAETSPDDLALLHFTSGTTGLPKGALHVHDAVLAHHVTGSFALDLHPDDVFWCTADPGWVTGTSYGIISPLSHGLTSVIDAGEFDAERWYRTIEAERVTVWYTAPTAVRMLMRAGAEVAAAFDLSSLRFVASVGEPLDPEAVGWGRDVLGVPIHDNWWQTETGGIMIANLASTEIRPGSMGRPLPGIEVALLALDDDGEVIEHDGEVELVAGSGRQGELAIRPGWPSMFRGYLHDEDRYERAFAGGWYRSGDLVTRDEDGYLWFVGRGDDVIKTAGHLVGPFEVESVLMAHPAVVDAAVIGLPDPVAGNLIKAFVTLAPGFADDDDLRLELIGFCRSRLGAAIAPRQIEVEDHLPHTRSGKIMRRMLRARELGQPLGDLSTLEREP